MKRLKFIKLFITLIITTCFLYYLIYGIYSLKITKLNDDDYLQLLQSIYSLDVAHWPKPDVDKGVKFKEMEARNKYNLDENKIILGRLLFNEKALSAQKTVSCASCHIEKLGYSDGLRVSKGENNALGTRNAPSVIPAIYFEKLFWDGRAASIKDQVTFPITNPVEMNNTLENALTSLQQMPLYLNLFLLVYDENNKSKISLKDIKALSKRKLDKTQKNKAKSLINQENLADAIATFEISLSHTQTRFNDFLKGDKNALSLEEIHGLHIFRTKAKCMNCHYGPALSDGKFHNIGLSFFGRKLQDLGRYEETKNINDLGAFKTPSLVLISKTKPYMHNGIFPDLGGVINMYRMGFPINQRLAIKRQEEEKKLGKKSKDITSQDISFFIKNDIYPEQTKLIHKLQLNRKEVDALAAFLKAI